MENDDVFKRNDYTTVHFCLLRIVVWSCVQQFAFHGVVLINNIISTSSTTPNDGNGDEYRFLGIQVAMGLHY